MQEFSLKEIFKTLIPKIKVIIAIVIIGAVLGGCVGVASSYAGAYFGTTLEFYINPKRGDNMGGETSQYGVYGAYGMHVMDNITKLLNSDSFAEELLLGENGLPIETMLAKESDRTAIDAKIAEAIGPINETEAARIALEEAEETLAEKKLEYANATSLASKLNSNYLSLISSTNPKEEEVAEAKRLSEEASTAEKQAKYDQEAAEQDAKLKKSEYQSKQKVSLEKIEAVLTLWRKTDTYKTYLEIMKSSAKYSYYREDEIQVGTSAEALAKSFIYVDLKATQDEVTAQFVYNRINEVLPRYVQENMAIPAGYIGTNCVKITRLDGIKAVSMTQIIISGVKVAAICGVLAFVLAAGWIVVSKYSKAWYSSIKAEIAEESSNGKKDEEEAQKAE